MAYPPAYSRDYSFTDFETLNPGVPKPGPALDTEFDDVSNALTATQTALALIQRADGALANGSVGEDQLDPTLFDHIADDAVADAEAAAAAAAASAGAAASSASAANGSATSAATSAATASGAAAQAGVSQGIAQDAANEAALSAAEAETAETNAEQAANDTAGSVAECEAHVQRAFEWAELLTGPVLPAPPGWPEAVDDGMFSSKWWAIRAREYNSTSTIDLGPGGETDIGEAFDNWAAIPGNELDPGQTYATWGTPTQTYVLIDRSNPSDPDSWLNITGGPGPPGPANTLTVGTVTTGAPGSSAIVSITGVSPNQVLNMQIPRGDTGATGGIGPAGPPNALAIGTVTTVPDGTPSSATITGTAPTQTLNLVLTAGPQGIQGIQGIQGPVGPAANLADPTGLIGLTAVNGVAATAPRSDATHALSQAIAPVWTGLHTFDLQVTMRQLGTSAAPTLLLDSAQPVLVFNESDQGVDAKRWELSSRASVFTLRGINDANSLSFTALTFARTALALNNISFGNATDNPTYTFLGTGLTTYSGSIQVNGDHIGLSNTDVYIQMIDTDAAVDTKVWWVRNSGGPFAIQTRADSFAAGMNAVLFTRVGTSVTQMLVGPDGSAALPAISFFNDNNTGMYRDSADSVVLVAGGQNILFARPIGVIVGTGNLYNQDGNGANPGYTFLNDQDTGFYRWGPDAFAATSGGAPVMSWRLGQSRINDGTVSNPALTFENETTAGFYRIGAGATGYTANGGVRVRFHGTVEPLSVVGGGALGSCYIGYYRSNGSSRKCYLGYGDTNSDIFYVMNEEAGGGVYLGTSGVPRLTIDSAGSASFTGTCSATSFTATSSRAIKRETGKPSKPASILARLRPLLYRLLDGDDHEQLGLIAEEVHEVCPQLSDGKTVAYDRLAILLLAAWQDEHAEAA